MSNSLLLAPLLALSLLLNGCGKKEVRASVPPAPSLPPTESGTASPAPSAAANVPNTSITLPPANAKPLYTQIGIASWYGPPYHNRRAANGEIYDMNQMTAAHRTLPLNSLVRITNLSTGHSAIVRITDRGPFIGERMIDLSLAAAKATDVWKAGLAWVRLEVLQTPVPIDTGGKWAVQIGAFDSTQVATKMKHELEQQYNTAKILEFAGPTGEWVRIRVPNDDKDEAEEISRTLTTPEGGVFLVRLD
ncbi:MAG TPA: septal ring lytic transglycosylase RlpA family protein [Terriglobales bacterium]|nr:septal ring lytic transglycosylase RlpA family protein [Terriglobales bacterium]